MANDKVKTCRIYKEAEKGSDPFFQFDRFVTECGADLGRYTEVKKWASIYLWRYCPVCGNKLVRSKDE